MKKPARKYYKKFLVLIILFVGIFLYKTISKSINASSTQILSSWVLTGESQAAEQYQSVESDILSGKDTLEISYDLNGSCLGDGDASAIIFDQPQGSAWRFISLSHYGINCIDGIQTVQIPLSEFPGLDTTIPVGLFHVRFWLSGSFSIEISRVVVYKNSNDKINANSQTSTVMSLQNPLGTGYKGEYFDNQNLSGVPTFIRDDSNINFLWKGGSPDKSIKNNHFSARWTKMEQYNSGDYLFQITADDGFRLLIDNVLVLDKWSNQNSNTSSINYFLTEGSHIISLEYFEDVGEAMVNLTYSQIQNLQIFPSTQPEGITATPTPTPTPTVYLNSGWNIKSVSTMKETKDKICNQDDTNFINKWLDKAVELGVGYVAVETPYDNPSCGDSLSYTKRWVDLIRARGLKVWHRHMPLAFEGIYNVSKNSGINYLDLISSYITNYSSLFQEGDIFTPIPEPQNGGISGITYCANGICQYKSKEHFNQWLRDAIDTSNNAFNKIGLTNMVGVGYYGFDGFVAWGDNNPDWNGILEDETVNKMGNITIDHYPELVGSTMAEDLNELHNRYPNTPIIIGEWGSVGYTDPQQQVIDSMGAAKEAPYVVGFNYWHMGMGGNESLINSDFTNRPQFSTVNNYFK